MPFDAGEERLQRFQGGLLVTLDGAAGGALSVGHAVMGLKLQEMLGDGSLEKLWRGRVCW